MTLAELSRCLSAACLLLAGLTPLAGAWGPAGHASVGMLAEQGLAGSRAEREVRSRLGGVSLAEAGQWADCIKAVRWVGDRLQYTEPGRFVECKPFESPAEQAAAVAFAAANWDRCGGGADEACHRRYHYTDVAVQQSAYAPGLAGTRPDDVVAAVGACIAQLQGRPVPAPFRFSNDTEALRLLVHLVGDLHQPLHVGAVYLDERGGLIDPDHQAHDRRHDTVGGNRLEDAGQNLHRRWDEVPATLGPQTLGRNALAEVRRVPPSPGPLADWPRVWASDTLHAARRAYAGLRYGPAQGQPRQWPVLNASASDAERSAAEREALQRQQLLKAGARLAQLLQALWP
jgi:hypothetical protein